MGVRVPTLDRVGVRVGTALLEGLRVVFGDREGDVGRQTPQEDWVNPGWQVPKMNGVHVEYPGGHARSDALLGDGDAEIEKYAVRGDTEAEGVDDA